MTLKQVLKVNIFKIAVPHNLSYSQQQQKEVIGMRDIIISMSYQRPVTHIPFRFQIYMECHS